MGMNSAPSNDQSPQEVRMPDPDKSVDAEIFDTTTKEGVLGFAAERRRAANMWLTSTHDSEGNRLNFEQLRTNKEFAASAIQEAEFREKQAEEMTD